jgi:ferrous iron transport protein A
LIQIVCFFRKKQASSASIALMKTSLKEFAHQAAEVTLDQIPCFKPAKVTAIQAEADLSQRMAALGLREQSVIQVLRHASFGGPVQVRVGTTEIIMRLKDARQIHLTTL